MKVPENIEIGGFTYKIEMSEETSAEMESKRCYADTSHYLKRIRLSNRCSNQQMTNDFLHEVLHCVSYIYSDDSVNEETIVVLANGLHQVFNQLGVVFDREKDVSV